MNGLSMLRSASLSLTAVLVFGAALPPALAHVAPDRWIESDQSGRDCTREHAITVMLDIGGQHWGKGRKYIDLQVVGKQFDEERDFYAKAKSKRFVVCRVERAVYDRIESGEMVNAVYTTYYPRKPGLSATGTVPPQSNSRVSLLAYGRFKVKH